MTKVSIQIPLFDQGEIKFELYAEGNSPENIFLISQEEAIAVNEAELQIVEGATYEYQISEGYSLDAQHGFVSTSKIHDNTGRIEPKNYVGRARIPIYKNGTQEKVGIIELEAKSKKTSYREDYRWMLKEISEYCVDLIFQPDSPVIQDFTVDFNYDSRTLYQKFAFIKSILDSDEFNEAVARVVSTPVTKWQYQETSRDIRSVKRFGAKNLRQLSSSSRRSRLPQDHSLHNVMISVPERINDVVKIDTIDTPENRFVKYALQTFLILTDTIREKSKNNTELKIEASNLGLKLEEYLSHSVFKEVSNIQTIPYNNPVLQRKDGYREVFRTWLMMFLAAKLTWSAGEEDIYGAGKRDVAILYEYWVFFKILSIVSELFNLKFPDTSKLIQFTENDISIHLKQGRHIPLVGVYDSPVRKLNIQFSYNKTFKKGSKYPSGGSWTESFRPDYTLSVWPHGLSDIEAETQELIVHVHFDAKYRIEKLSNIISTVEQIDDEVIGNETSHKKDDLIKMHAYRDAIRRTAGAYIIYPGDSSIQKRGYHELIPGLGAFTLRPAPNNSGVDALKVFIGQVLEHFLNRASQRERYSFKTFDTHKEPPKNIISESIPEAIGINRALIPDETIILVGYYKGETHLDWILEKKLYNVRTGTGIGALSLDLNLISASYLILYTEGGEKTNQIFKIVKNHHKVYSQTDMLKTNYPNPRNKNYIVFELERGIESEFEEKQWDLTKLKGFNERIVPSAPFYVTLSELMAVVVKS